MDLQEFKPYHPKQSQLFYGLIRLQLPEITLKKLNQLREIMNPRHNYSQYRSKLQKAPALPYLSKHSPFKLILVDVFLADITPIEPLNPDYLADPAIYFEKLKTLG